MPFVGMLKLNSTANVVVQNNSVDKVATTTLKINRRDRITDAEPNTVLAGASNNFSIAIGDRIDRVIIMVSPPVGGRATVTVNALSSINCDADTHLVFDTEP